MLLAFNRLCNLVHGIVRIVVLLQATGIFAIIIYTVFTRYVLNFVVSWSEEVPRYLLIWVSFLGAAICVDLKDHIAFDYIYNRLPRLVRPVVEFGINVGVFAFGYIMLVFGIDFVRDFGGDFMESIPFTNVWYYTAMPISGGLIMLFALRSQLNATFGTGMAAADGAPSR